jgi:putative membrane protein
MKILTKGLVLTAAVAFLVPLSLLAAEKRLVEKKAADSEPKTDLEFLAKAISAEIAEVKFGEKAVKNAESKDVRAYAQKIIDDHTKQRDALLKQAKSMKMAVVEGLEKDTREEMTRLSKLSGGNFDKEYIKFMVEGHEKLLRMYENWSKTAKDSELRELATKAVPTVKEHLRLARELQTKLRKS